MRKLEELKARLYKKDQETVEQQGGRTVEISQPPLQYSWTGSGSPNIKSVQELEKRRTFRIFLFIGVVGFLIFTGFIIFYLLGVKTREATVSIFAEEEVEAGETVNYRIEYRNKSRSFLRDGEVVFTYPEDSIPVGDENLEGQTLKSRLRLDDIAPGGSGEILYKAKILGREGELKAARATLFYRPEGASARFSESAEFNTKITRFPLSLSFEVSPEIVSGQEIEVVLNYNSNSRSSFNNLALRIDYPDGFTPVFFGILPKYGNNIWIIDTLLPQISGKISVKGKMTGSPGEKKIFHSLLGSFDSDTRKWRAFGEASGEISIFSPPLSVEQKVNDSRNYIAKPGERLNFALHYKNNFNAIIKNVTVAVEVSSPLLELEHLEVHQGIFDALSKKIIWNSTTATELSKLAPGASGDLTFSIPLKSSPSLNSPSDRNFIVSSQAAIESKTPPESAAGLSFSSTDELKIKVSSKLLFSAKSLYYSASLPGSGPLPPRAEKTTIYTIAWDLRNFSNDLKGVQIKGVLGPNIHWVGQNAPRGEHVTFSESSSEVVWDAGQIAAGTGIINSSRAVAFQVSITPAPSDVGKSLQLMDRAVASGIDAFTDQAIESSSDPVSTELKDDPRSQSSEWTVKK